MIITQSLGPMVDRIPARPAHDFIVLHARRGAGGVVADHRAVAGTVAPMGRFEYIALLVGCVVVTLPLEFVFRARVYRRLGRLLRAMVLPVLLFWVIDSMAMVRGLWSYSRRYTIGFVIPHKLPIEEIGFFVIVPICAILTFETAANVYSGKVLAPWNRARRRPSGHVEHDQANR